MSDLSVEKRWVKARGEALLKNIDFIDVIQNVKKNLAEIAQKHECEEDELVEWFMGQMPLVEE